MKLQQYHQPRDIGDESSESKDLNEHELNSPNSQLHECYKCELIFRNYEMFRAHKLLHEIQDQSAEDAPNGTLNVNVQSHDKQKSHQDLNRLIAENIQQNLLQQGQRQQQEQEQQQQQQQKFSEVDSPTEEHLECNQCDLKMSNALEFFIHVHSFHANGLTTALDAKNPSELKQES